MKRLIKTLLGPSFKYTLEDLDCSLCLYYGGKKIRSRFVLQKNAAAQRKSTQQSAEIGDFDTSQSSHKTTVEAYLHICILLRRCYTIGEIGLTGSKFRRKRGIFE